MTRYFVMVVIQLLKWKTQQIIRKHLYWSAGAAMMQCHRAGGTVSQFWRQEVRGQAVISGTGSWGGLLPSLSSVVDDHLLPVSSHGPPSSWGCISSFQKNSSGVTWGHLDHILFTLSPNQGTPEALGLGFKQVSVDGS